MAFRIIEKGESPPFNGKRLAQARAIARLSVEELAEEMDVLPLEINMLEAGGQPQNLDLVEDLAMLLAFPVPFFYQDDPPEFGPSTLDFHIKRKRR